MVKRFSAYGVVLIIILLIVLATIFLMTQGGADSYEDHFYTATAIARENNQTITIADRSSQPSGERIVIKNANLNLVVDDPTATMNNIILMTQNMGGWVVNSNTRNYTVSQQDYTRASITVRIPSEQLNNALETIKTEAISVASETVTGQDVTQEYVDSSSRLANLQAAEEQLQGIMDNATTTEDVLAVHSELVRVRGEIEVIQGRLQFIEESAAFSSVTVDLQPEIDENQATESNKWKPADTVQDAFDALIVVLRFLVDLAIVVVVLVLPLILIIGIPGRFAYRLAKNKGWLEPNVDKQVSNNLDAVQEQE